MRVPSIRFAHVRRGKADAPPGLVGVARVDPRTKVLVKRLAPGDIAIIDHADLDRVSADELIACPAAAVVNAARSITGRYPNLGPRLLLDAGIPLVDDVGREVLARVAEGALVRLDGDVLYKGDQVIAKGVLLTEETLDEAMDEATAGVPSQIDAFAANTLEFLRRERDLLTNGIDNCRRWPPTWTAGTCSSWSAATATARTCGRCGPISASTARCCSPWTAARTRCSRSATGRT